MIEEFLQQLLQSGLVEARLLRLESALEHDAAAEPDIAPQRCFLHRVEAGRGATVVETVEQVGRGIDKRAGRIEYNDGRAHRRREVLRFEGGWRRGSRRRDWPCHCGQKWYWLPQFQRESSGRDEP